jgi:hypothetical protein
MPYNLIMEPDPHYKPDRGNDLTPPHLMPMLELSVRMRLSELKLTTWEEQIQAGRHQELAQIIAEKGDTIMFRGKKKGESAAAFNALAESIAMACLVPGGIRFMGYWWTADPIRKGMRRSP